MFVAGLLAASGAIDVDMSSSSMRPLIERYQIDKATLERFWSEGVDGGRGRGAAVDPLTPDHVARMRRFYGEWSETLRSVPFDSFDQASKIGIVVPASGDTNAPLLAVAGPRPWCPALTRNGLNYESW
jgi:hypothetical protein